MKSAALHYYKYKAQRIWEEAHLSKKRRKECKAERLNYRTVGESETASLQMKSGQAFPSFHSPKWRGTKPNVQRNILGWKKNLHSNSSLLLNLKDQSRERNFIAHEKAKLETKDPNEILFGILICRDGIRQSNLIKFIQWSRDVIPLSAKAKAAWWMIGGRSWFVLLWCVLSEGGSSFSLLVWYSLFHSFLGGRYSHVGAYCFFSCYTRNTVSSKPPVSDYKRLCHRVVKVRVFFIHCCAEEDQN